jgi:hypothetical protein
MIDTLPTTRNISAALRKAGFGRAAVLSRATMHHRYATGFYVRSSGAEVYVSWRPETPLVTPSGAWWATKPVHMTEKCTEADVYRRAFPQDYSGIELSDAMPEPDPSAPAVQAQPQRATADQIRNRRPAVQAAAEPVTDPSPAAESAPPVAEPADDAHEPPKASPGQVGKIRERFEYFGYTDDDKAARLRDTAKLAGCKGELTSTKNLTADQAASVLRQIQNLTDAQALMDLLQNGEVHE